MWNRLGPGICYEMLVAAGDFIANGFLLCFKG